MRTLFPALAAIVLGACATAERMNMPNRSAPESASAPAPAPASESAPAFFAALSAHDDDRALALLQAHPELALAHTPKGTSAYFAALGRIVGTGFLRPQENRPALAIFALHPPLDAFESAAAGDVARVEEELRRDPGFVSRGHTLGWTPLHFAAFGGQPRVAELLLAHGAAVDAVAQNHFGNTPLQVGLLTVQEGVTRVLLAHGANVNFRAKEGVTALHEAAQSGDGAIVRLLLDAGADPTLRTGRLDDGREGLTALDFARSGHRDEVVRLLEERSGAGKSP